MPTGDLRQSLLNAFEAALAAVDARRNVRVALERNATRGDWHVVAIGKAAGAMCLGAVEALDARLADALVVTKPGHVPGSLLTDGRVQVVESSHPLPDERSLAAGEAVSSYVTSLPSRANLLFLVSGGASSLVERLVPGASLDDLAELNAWALRSGCDIRAFNALRRRISTLKGGGLARLAGPRRARALFVSDVPGDDPAVIGSGLLHSAADLRTSLPDLPPRLKRVIDRAPSADGAGVPPVPYRIVASVRDACRAAAVAARASGLAARVARQRFDGDAAELGQRFARVVAGGRPRTLYVWGGESTIILPPEPGHGGRNQHLALSAAIELDGTRDATLLAAGTDGIDGVTQDAGAIVDGGTVERGRDAGLDARRSLNGADSGHFLEATGDLLHTGPTLTNVGDLVLGVGGRSRTA